MTRPLPRPLTGDDLLDLAARAKATREVTADEAFQLGEGLEILAADLERSVLELERARTELDRWRRNQRFGRRTRPANSDGAPDTLVVDVPIAGGAR